MRISTLCVQLFILSSVIATPHVGKERTILEVLDDDYRFARLMDALNKERTLTEELIDRPKAEMTVFAPTNEAFRKLRDRFRGRYPKDLLKEMIQYHVIYKVTPSETLDEIKLFQTSLQLKELGDRMQSVRITRHNGKPLLNGHARLQETDMGAINGMIHAIDEVLIPPPEINKVLLRSPSLFSTMSAALQRTGLDKKVQGSTGMSAFVPTNQAFRNLGCRALNYLFSRDGEKDLRKLVEYHFSNKLSYSMDMLNEVTGGGGIDKRKPGRGRGRGREDKKRRGGGNHRDDDWAEENGMILLELDHPQGHTEDMEADCYDQRDLYSRYPNRGRRGGWDDDDDDHPRRGGDRRGRGGWDDDDDYYDQPRRGGDRDRHDHPRHGGDRRGRGGWDDDDDYYDQPRHGGDRRGRGGWDDDDDYYDQPRRGGDRDRHDHPRHGGDRRGRGGWDDDDDYNDQPRRGGDRHGRDDWDDDRNGRGRHGRGDRDDEDDRRGRHGRHPPHRGGRHGSDEFEKIKFPSMLGGEKLEIYLNPNSLRGNHFDIIVNNEARVVFSDYVAKNGVIHGLDNILIPKGLNVPEDWFDDEPCDF